MENLNRVNNVVVSRGWGPHCQSTDWSSYTSTLSGPY